MKYFFLPALCCFMFNICDASEFIVKKNNKSVSNSDLNEAVISLAGDLLELMEDCKSELVNCSKYFLKETRAGLENNDKSFTKRLTKKQRQDYLSELNSFKDDIEIIKSLKLDKKLRSIKDKFALN